MEKWSNILENDIKISVLTKILPSKGNLVYEYNPFRNYRLSESMYEYLGQLYSKELLENIYNLYWDKEEPYEGNPPEQKGNWYFKKWDPTTEEYDKEFLTEDDEAPITKMKGELVDFITDELSFDLAHPVTIIPLYSYDGSVNLLLTDGKNEPRIINSRFSATGKDTYEIVDRKGNNDANIYDLGNQFDVDTSLYKRVKLIPKLKLKEVSSGGNLKCGNYHFYFKLADADGNETDFVAESGLVSIFIGESYPLAVYTGNRDENSVKLVSFLLTNIDAAYSYVYVYYSRYTAEDGSNRIISYKKIDKKYLINNFLECNILITGFENTDEVTREDINLYFNVVDAAKTAATAKGRLFLGNVHKPNIPFEKLTDLSLRFLPYLKDKKYDLDIDEEYNISSNSKGYYDPIYIYNNVGYWNKELYRLGIVYLLSNGELSPVFNIRGRTNLTNFRVFENAPEDLKFYCDNLYYYFDHDTTIGYNETTNLIIPPKSIENAEYPVSSENENVKGVISFDSMDDTNTIHAIDIHVDSLTIRELKKLGIKGYFFVRQTRIPLILALGITVGIDKAGRLPTIPTKGGILSEIENSLANKTYVETKDIRACNYISEGFLTRYTFDLKKKPSSIWKQIGKIDIAAAIVAAVAAATIVSCGVALPGVAAVAGALSSIGIAAGIAATATAAVILGAAVGAVAGAIATGIVAGTDELIKAISRQAHPKLLKGKKTEIPNGYERKEIEESRLLGLNFKDRIIIKDYTHNEVGGIICPEYDVVPQFYNLLFTGGEFVIKTSASLATINKFIDAYYKNPETLSGLEDILFGYYFTNNNRHFYMPFKSYSTNNMINTYSAKLLAVPDNITCATIGRIKFRSRAGDKAEAWRYEYIGEDFKNIPSFYSKSEELTAQAKEQSIKKEVIEDNSNEITQTDNLTNTSDQLVRVETAEKEINSDIVRGSYGPYIGMSGYKGLPGETVSIMIPGYSDTLMSEYIKIRMDDVEPYYAISDRIDINDLKEFYIKDVKLLQSTNKEEDCAFEVTRGDCYICQFTHRVNRNFNDDTAPYNSEIVDANTWKDHYKINKSEEFSKINKGDVNAVNLGMWVTFTVRSSKNLNIRSLDGSVVAETALMGHPRGFFPHDGMIADGSYKSSEALVFNDGFAKNLSERHNTVIADFPYNDRERNWYGTRIMHSDIHINNAYKNGYRVFLGTHFKDYSRLYGEITKLLNYKEDLIVVFEHGIARLPISERTVAGEGPGGTTYINTSKILPDTLLIISEAYGSTWPDSVLMTPNTGDDSTSIFGVDTVAKKIWRISENRFEIISNLKVQEFLNQNITFTEREKDPILGIRNVKTTYNAFKHDVMFTFYDDLAGTEEKAWNLCYNTLMGNSGLFTTFYSWVPSFMENINNIPFSFNRNVSKWIAKLGQSHAENSFAEGIVLSNNQYDNLGKPIGKNFIKYTRKDSLGKVHEIKAECSAKPNTSGTLIGTFNLLNHILPEGDGIEYLVAFELLRDIYGYYKRFEVKEVNVEVVEKDGEAFIDLDNKYTMEKAYGLFLKESDSSDDNPLYFSELYYRNKAGHTYNDYDDYKVTIQEYDLNHCKINDLSESLIAKLNESGVSVKGNEVTLTKLNYFKVVQALELPIFHGRDGTRPNLPNPLYKENIVLLLNIKATIYAKFKEDKSSQSLADFLRQIRSESNNSKSDLKIELESDNSKSDTPISQETWYNAGTYESSIAVTSKWNCLFLTSDFWKHGLAGIIDKTEDITPTKWYGELHPFEFEVIVANGDFTHKIFLNLEIIANKAKPESFHFEIIGETYDFAKDKPNMYFRLEARKALFLYNGCDISYDKNFRKINPKLQPKSAELVHNYFERLDTLIDIYDNYNLKDSVKLLYYPQYEAWANLSPNKDYRHLSGAEIVYYPNRQEYRIWQHLPAIDLNDLPLDSASSIIRGNCLYLEDRWRVSINPLLICYKNEYIRRVPGVLCLPQNSTWPSAMTSSFKESETKLPPITIRNTNLPKAIKKAGKVDFPNENNLIGRDNALFGLYSWEGNCPVDNTNWLSDLSIYKMDFGEALNRKETDIRDKFVKVRIRYSGEELAIIDFLNTIYTTSYA